MGSNHFSCRLWRLVDVNHRRWGRGLLSVFEALFELILGRPNVTGQLGNGGSTEEHDGQHDYDDNAVDTKNLTQHEYLHFDSAHLAVSTVQGLFGAARKGDVRWSSSHTDHQSVRMVRDMPPFLSATNRAVAVANTAMTTTIRSIDLGPFGSNPRSRHV